MLIQGANNPLVIQFDDSVEDLDALVITLWRETKLIKQWNKNEMLIDGDTVVCPLTEEETDRIISTPHNLEIKGVDENGYTIFYEKQELPVLYRNDKAIVLAEQSGVEPSTPPGTGVIVFPRRKGYIFGDSFIWGRNGDTQEQTHNPVHNTINTLLGTRIVNKGMTGALGYVSANTTGTAYDVINETDLSDADIVILCFGTNDGPYQIGDTETSGTIMYELNRCVQNIYARKPDCRVIIFAPWKQNSDYFSPARETYPNSRAELSEAMKTFCSLNFIPFISMENNPFNTFNLANGVIDELVGSDHRHPNERGYVLLGQWMAGEIRRIIG